MADRMADGMADRCSFSKCSRCNSATSLRACHDPASRQSEAVLKLGVSNKTLSLWETDRVEQ
jgi:hypothetical protein